MTNERAPDFGATSSVVVISSILIVWPRKAIVRSGALVICGGDFFFDTWVTPCLWVLRRKSVAGDDKAGADRSIGLST